MWIWALVFFMFFLGPDTTSKVKSTYNASQGCPPEKLQGNQKGKGELGTCMNYEEASLEVIFSWKYIIIG